MCVSPNAIKLNGITLLSTPVTAKEPHIGADHGSRRPVANRTGTSTTAANATRTNAIVNGGTPASSRTL